jgi:xylulose-5-phosphate/fructose-6-phosphate phosphoketolase
MGNNPITNPTVRPLVLPNFADYGIKDPQRGMMMASDTTILGTWLRDVIKLNDSTRNFRIFGPDETASNRLQAVYEVTNKQWMAEIKESDDTLAQEGRVMEILSEHQCEGWLEGYLLAGGHGLLNSYEAFIHIITSMVNQHQK